MLHSKLPLLLQRKDILNQIDELRLDNPIDNKKQITVLLSESNDLFQIIETKI